MTTEKDYLEFWIKFENPRPLSWRERTFKRLRRLLGFI